MTDEQTNELERAAKLLKETSRALKSVANQINGIVAEIDSTPHPENRATVKDEDQV